MTDEDQRPTGTTVAADERPQKPAREPRLIREILPEALVEMQRRCEED